MFSFPPFLVGAMIMVLLASLPRGNRVHTNEVLSGGFDTPRRTSALCPADERWSVLHFLRVHFYPLYLLFV